ncbi:DNA topoisomerase 1-like [Protopterus annectens]|uniref:DNA topoisomerase 1-like n=1 Tax=Protopterus annectens TaxID=7888 RepID=UPI001CF96CC2|nr:DNA topoisomerase 1-like [Protopterus annectens]
MSGDHFLNDAKIEPESRVNGLHEETSLESAVTDSHKEKHKEKDREHKHKDHKKEKSKHSNSEYKESSEKKHKDKEKLKHKDGGPDRHKDGVLEKFKDGAIEQHRDALSEKHKDSHSEKHKDNMAEKHKDISEKYKDGISEKHKDGISEKIKEKHKDGISEKHKEKHKDGISEKHKEKHKDGASEKHKEKHKDKEARKEDKLIMCFLLLSIPHIKEEPEDLELYTPPKENKPLKRPMDENDTEFQPKKIKSEGNKKVKSEDVKKKVKKGKRKHEEEDHTPKKKIKNKENKSQKGDAAQGKKKQKKEEVEKWKCTAGHLPDTHLKAPVYGSNIKKIKEENERLLQEYGFCTMDNHKERIANFKIEPPGLFRGRGNHPKMGMLKRRLMPEDVIINCSKDSKVPEPPEGHKWKEVRHDNKVTWLVSWTENIQCSIKYIMLNPSSRIKGEKDWQKYETARRLKKCVDKIRAQYREDWKSKEMKVRQRAVALYFIDKLALRAGNEKEEGETADTVGCCSLRVEHINLHPEIDGQEYVVEFDFLGKDSIRYYNKVPVEKRVFKNLELFMENKQSEDDLFDRLNTTILNKHLQDLMEGLTAKVFRTYNASITLQQQLKELTNVSTAIYSPFLIHFMRSYSTNALPYLARGGDGARIDAKKEQLTEARRELKSAKTDAKVRKDEKTKKMVEAKKKVVQRIEEQLMKLEVQATDREENKQIALGTSKLNYLDPRISVAWCKKWGVPIEKIYNKTQRDKFAWAIDMAEIDYEF